MKNIKITVSACEAKNTELSVDYKVNPSTYGDGITPPTPQEIEIESVRAQGDIPGCYEIKMHTNTLRVLGIMDELYAKIEEAVNEFKS